MSAMPIKTYTKAVIERRRLYLDYSCWLEEAEMLTDSQVTVTPYTADFPITVTTGYTDATQKKLVMFVGGGKAHTNYVLSLVVRTDAGQVKRDDIGVRVTG
jgi:hypothetical protein